MNTVILKGNLTKDVELKYSKKEKPYCKFRIAVNDGYGDDQRTAFVPITVFGRQAENCDKYLRKGSPVIVKGKIDTDDYENEDGERIYVWSVIAEDVEFLGGARNDEPPQGTTDFRNEDFEEMA